jgi:hypothetical protein
MQCRLLLLFALFVGSGFSQTSVLTGFRNGSWALLDTNGVILTTTDYHYIHNFDQNKTTFFMRNGIYGIMGADGKEKITARYIDILQHGFGIYSVRENDVWSLIQVGDQTRTLRDSVNDLPHVLGPNWLTIGDSTESGILNLPSGIQLPKTDSSVLVLNTTQYLALVNDSLVQVYTPTGKLLLSTIGQANQYYTNYLIIVDTLGDYTIINENGIMPVPFTINEFEINNETYFVGSLNLGILYDYKSKKEIFRGPYSLIQIYDEHYFYVAGRSGVNLIDRTTKKALLPNQLNYFYKSKENYFVYHNNGTMALLDLKGKFVINGFFDFIEAKGQFYILTVSGNKGLYSVKKKAFVLPMIYYSISDQKNGRYKAITDNAFTVIQLDENHNIEKRIDGSNNVSLRTAVKRNAKPFIDPRLFPLGWYIDSSEVEIKGEMTVRYLWGLNDEMDSVILKPKYPDLRYIHGPYSLSVNRNRPYIEPNGARSFRNTYEFVSWENGKKVPSLECIYVDSNDFSTQTWTKFQGENKIGIINEEGKIRYFTYLSGKSDPFTRYCEAPLFERAKKICDTSFYQVSEEFLPYENASLGNCYVVKNGKWNFLKPDGSDLFKEPFSFVQEFEGSTAIAKRNGKWGVITKDTILIPFIYNGITRRIVGADTLFIVDELPVDSRFLDESLTVIPEFKNITVKSENLLLVEQKGKQHLANERREIIIENVRNIKKLPSGYFRAKVEKEIQILDSAGIAVCTTENEVVDVFLEKFCVIEKNNRFGLTDFSNNVVLIENNSSLQSVGKYIIAKSDQYYLYNAGFELVAKSTNPILVDPVSNNYTITKKTTTTVYNAQSKLAKLKNVVPSNFWNNLVWTTVKDASYGIASNGDTLVKCEKLEEYLSLPNDWKAIKQEKGSWIFFTQDWKPIATPVSSRKFIYLNTGHIALFTKKTTWLIWDPKNNNSREVSEIIGDFGSELCLVRTGKKFRYITTSLKDANNLNYISATPFHNGKAATSDGRGGTLINFLFQPMSYPSYIGLSYVGSGIYKASPQLTRNIFRLNGSKVLETNVEKVEFINNNIIQTVSKGEIHYFRISGAQMF